MGFEFGHQVRVVLKLCATIAHFRALGDTIMYGARCQQAMVPWFSCSPPQTFHAITMGGFARCRHLASDKFELIHSLNRFCSILTTQGGYPATWVAAKLKKCCDNTFGSQAKLHDAVWKASQPHMDVALNRSLLHPQVCFVVGKLRLQQL